MRRQADQLRRSIREQVRAHRDMSSSVHHLRQETSAQDESVRQQLESLDQIIGLLQDLEHQPNFESLEVGLETMHDSGDI